MTKFNELNGFARFHGTVTNVHEIHVYLDSGWPSRKWRTRGWHRDYGIADTREEAIKIAIDAKLSALFDVKIYVHKGYGPYEQRFVITRVRGKAHSQFFQDAVS